MPQDYTITTFAVEYGIMEYIKKAFDNLRKDVRNEALEEAAQLIENPLIDTGRYPVDIAKVIRALKTK